MTYIDTAPENLRVIKLKTLVVKNFKWSGVENIVNIEISKLDNPNIEFSEIYTLSLNSLFISLLNSPFTYVNRGNYYITGFDTTDPELLIIKIYVKGRNNSFNDQLNIHTEESIYFCQGLNLKVVTSDEEKYFDRSLFNHELVYDDEQQRLKLCNSEESIVIANLRDLSNLGIFYIDLDSETTGSYDLNDGQIIYVKSKSYNEGLRSYLVVKPFTFNLEDKSTYPENNLDKISYDNYLIGTPVTDCRFEQDSDFLDYPKFKYGDQEKTIRPGQPFSIKDGENMILPAQSQSVVIEGEFEPEKTSQQIPNTIITGTSNNTDLNGWLNRSFINGDRLPWNFRNSSNVSHIQDVLNPKQSDFILLNLSDDLLYLNKIQINFRSAGGRTPGLGFVQVQPVKLTEVNIPSKWVFKGTTIAECDKLSDDYFTENPSDLIPLVDPENNDTIDYLNSVTIKKYEVTDGDSILNYYYVYVNYTVSQYNILNRPVRFIRIKTPLSNINLDNNGVLSRDNWNSLDKEVIYENLMTDSTVVKTDSSISFEFLNKIQISEYKIYALEFLPDTLLENIPDDHIFYDVENATTQINSYIYNNPSVLESGSFNYSPNFVADTEVRAYSKVTLSLERNTSSNIFYKLDDNYSNYAIERFKTDNVPYGQIAVKVNISDYSREIYEWKSPDIPRYTTLINFYRQTLLTAESSINLKSQAFILADRKIYTPDKDISEFVPYQKYLSLSNLNTAMLLNPSYINNNYVVYNDTMVDGGFLYKFKSITLKPESFDNYVFSGSFETLDSLNKYINPVLDKDDQSFSRIKLNIANVLNLSREYVLDWRYLKLGNIENLTEQPPAPNNNDEYYVINSTQKITKWNTDKLVWEISDQDFETANKFYISWLDHGQIGLNTQANLDNITYDLAEYNFTYSKDLNQIRYTNCSWVKVQDSSNLGYYFLETNTEESALNILTSSSQYTTISSLSYSTYCKIGDDIYNINLEGSSTKVWIKDNPVIAPVAFDPTRSFTSLDIANYYLTLNPLTPIDSLGRIKKGGGSFTIIQVVKNDLGNLEWRPISQTSDLIPEDQIFTNVSDRDEFFKNNPLRLNIDSEFYSPLCKVGSEYEIYVSVGSFTYKVLGRIQKRLAFEYLRLFESKFESSQNKLLDDTVYYIAKIFKTVNGKKEFIGIGSDIDASCKNLLSVTLCDYFEIIGSLKTLKDNEFIINEENNTSSNLGLLGDPNSQNPENLFTFKDGKWNINTYALSILHDYIPFKSDWELNTVDGNTVKNPYISYESIYKPFTFKSLINLDRDDSDEFYIRYKNKPVVKFSSQNIELYKNIKGTDLAIDTNNLSLNSEQSLNLKVPDVNISTEVRLNSVVNQTSTNIAVISNDKLSLNKPLKFVNNGDTLKDSNDENVLGIGSTVDIYKDIKFIKNSTNIVDSNNAVIASFNTDKITVNKLIDGTATHAYYSDYAECYESKENYEAGTLVDLNKEGILEEAREECLGVVSENPGVLIGTQSSGVPLVMMGKSKVLLDTNTIQHSECLKVKTKLYLSSFESGRASYLENGNPIGIVLKPYNKETPNEILALLILNI